MKDYALELASRQVSADSKFNILREYLQAYILRIMHTEGMFQAAAFLGGTALRFLHGLPRFSEDLDFSVSGEKTYSFVDIIKKIRHELILAGYEISISYNEKKTVQHAFIGFAGLLHEAEISPYREQKISIKVEIDTKPPKGAILKTYVVDKYFPISFLSYDISSLFAGKLHALLRRKYTKGRDFFDLGWYLSRWKDITPNIILLKNALEQTGWKGEIPAEDNWRDFMYDIVKKTDWDKVEKDVGKFVENPSDMKIFTRENVLQLVANKP